MDKEIVGLYRWILKFGAEVKQVREIADNVYLVSIETPLEPSYHGRLGTYRGWITHHKLEPFEVKE